MAIFTKKGKQFDTTGKVLYGPVDDEQRLQGLRRRVRGAQQRRRGRALRPARRSLADRDADLPRGAVASGSAAPRRPGEPARRSSVAGRRGPAGRRGAARSAAAARRPPPAPPAARAAAAAGAARRRRRPQGPYSMCYAISTGPDPLGPYYRYEFLRPLFPDYPRPGGLARRLLRPDQHRRRRSIREARLRRRSREDARRASRRPSSASIIDDVNFLNNADLDGKALPPRGRAEHHDGGRRHAAEERCSKTTAIYVWQFHVDWKDPSKTTRRRAGEDRGRAVSLPVRRPAHELRAAAGHRSAARRAGRQDHGAARLSAHRQPRVDRRRALGQHVGGRRRRALVRVPPRQRTATSRCISRARTRPTASTAGWRARRSTSTATSASAIRSAARRTSPASASPARLADDPLGQLTLRETVLVEGEAAQTNTLRWEDYTQTAIDPTDDCTIWYVGDYLKKDAAATRPGSARSGCPAAGLRAEAPHE